MGNMSVGLYKKRTKVMDIGIKIGDKFGRLTVIADGYDLPLPNGLYKPQYLCQCSCPKHTLMFVMSERLRNGTATSCGCEAEEKANQVANTIQSQGFEMPPEIAVKVYNLIYDRCYNPNVVGYHNHYGANIELCPRWKDPVNGFNNFCMDMGPSFNGCREMERYDRTKDYSPENCYWISVSKIKYDGRPSKNRFQYDGCDFTIDEWAKLLGCRPTLIYCRIHNKGWTNPEEILFGKFDVGPHREYRGYRASRNAVYFLDENGQPDFSIDPQK